MLQFFRNFFKSKIGLGITSAFLALIALAFASSDVANTGTFGGVSGGDRVAIVGDSKIGTAMLRQSATSALDRMRQQNPTLSMQAFVEQGGLDKVLDQLIDRVAVAEFARKYGLRAGDNLVNSEIIKIPAFRGADGNFSQDVYQTALRQQGLSDTVVRDDMASGLLAQQVLVPAGLGARVPDAMARQYAALLKERRKGAIGILPSSAFAPQGKPTDAQLQAFYNTAKSRFIRPERRVIRFATFGTEALGKSAEPTDAEIAAAYQKDKAKYAASEERTITQIIVPTEQGAKALRDELVSGTSFDAVARQAGFRPAKIGPLTRQALIDQSSTAVADAVFAAGSGSTAALARSALGWHVIRIDAVKSVAAKSIADARPEIEKSLRAQKTREAIADLSARVEEEIDQGTALVDLAKELKAELKSTKPLTADGRIYGVAGQAAPKELASSLSTAFQMQEGEPQLAEVVPGQLFLIYEVTDITESAPAPLAEIRPGVELQWRMAEGAKGARAAADRILARIAKGSTLAAAMAAESRQLPPADTIDLDRQQLAAMSVNQGVPPPLALMFSMAQGTTKKLEGANRMGWFVVDLDSVTAQPLANDDPLIKQTSLELAQLAGREYSDQFVVAMKKELGVERNRAAITAVSKQLVGSN